MAVGNYDTGNAALDNRLNYLEKTFGVDTTAKADGWAEDIAAGENTLDGLWRGLLRSRVGREKVEEWALAAGVPKQHLPNVVDNLMSGERTFNQAAKKFGGQSPASPTDKTIPALTILSSPNARWLRDQSTGLYYIEYQLPGGTGSLVFEAEEEQVDALFGKGVRPSGAQSITFDSYVRQDAVHFGGNVAEMEGEGRFEDEFRRTTALALDQEQLPQWILNDSVAMDALFVKFTEGRTNEWFYDFLSSKSKGFRTRYPGVGTLKERGLSTAEAVRAHTEYETKLKTLHAAAGFSDEGITPFLVGTLIEKGYSVNQITDSYGTWKRMRDHAPALQAFNEILVANGQKALNGRGMYKFLQGTAPDEVYDLYEGAALTESARAAGLGQVFNANDALSLALETSEDFSVNQAYERFSNVAAQALRFRHELAIEQYGLDVDELIDLSFGRAPRTGRDAAEVGEILSRITKAAEASIQNRVQPFTGFTPDGRPQRRSLSGLRQEE